MDMKHAPSRATVLGLTALAALALVAAACDGDAEPTLAASEVVTAGPSPAVPALPSPTPAPTATDALVTPVPTPVPVSAAVSPIGDPRPAPALADLVLPDGSTFDLAALAGSNVLVYFGYTHCPDVCPATLGELFGVFEEAPQTQALFISVDPERDTPEFLGEWTAYLPDNIHAMTGSPGAIRRAADNYGVKYARVETTSTAGYTMSHTAALYLIDAYGQLLLEYPYGTPAAEIVTDLRTLEAG